MAAFIDRDRRLLALDADAGQLDPRRWESLLREVENRWSVWSAFERTDGFKPEHGGLIVATWIAPYGVLLVELTPTSSFGLLRLRIKPQMAELERALEGHEPDEGSSGSSGSDGRPLH